MIHGNRGRSSPRKLPGKTHRRIVEVAQGKYRGFNDHHLTEKLTDAEGITVVRETVRQLLRAVGLASPRRRRLPRHPAWRERRAAEATAAWRGGDRTRLAHSRCFKYRRVVAKDNTVAFHGVVLPLPKGSPFVSWAHKAVNLHVLRDGSAEIFFQNDRLARFDSKTARAMGLYRTNGRREGSSYGPETTTAGQHYALAP